MDNGNIVVSYATRSGSIRAESRPISTVVYQSADKAANGDAAERTRLLGDWNEALAAFKGEKSSVGVMSTPRNAMASRLQTYWPRKPRRRCSRRSRETVGHPAAQSITTAPGVQSSVPTVQEVQFDNEDVVGWLGMGVENSSSSRCSSVDSATAHTTNDCR